MSVKKYNILYYYYSSFMGKDGNNFDARYSRKVVENGVSHNEKEAEVNVPYTCTYSDVRRDTYIHIIFGDNPPLAFVSHTLALNPSAILQRIHKELRRNVVPSPTCRESSRC